MAQTWHDLLFMHWPLAPEILRPLVPERLTLDTRDGRAWLAVAPFEVRGLRLRGTPPLPGISRFAELNVRTYVTYDRKPGIWFFSLDAASAPAVAGARRTYHLPYFHARMNIARAGGRIRYRSVRGAARLDVEYAPAGPARPPAPGTLEHWLAERYCLYALDGRGSLRRAEIHHLPWPLQPAEATLHENAMAPHGVALPPGAPLLHFAGRQDVIVWRPRHA